MTRTNNALSQLTGKPEWDGSLYADGASFDPGIYKKFDPSKFKAVFPNYSQTGFPTPSAVAPTQPDTTVPPIQGPVATESPSPIDKIVDDYRKLWDFEQGIAPERRAANRMRIKDEADIAYEQAVRSLPMLNQAADLAAGRAVAGTMAVRTGTDLLPTYQQNRMSAASSSAAQAAQATAFQQQAANEFAKRYYAGKTFQSA